VNISLPASMVSKIESELYDKQEGRLRILLTHAIRLQTVLETMLRTFPTADPFKGYADLGVIWDSTKAYGEQYRKCPSDQMLKDDLQGRTVFKGVNVDLAHVFKILEEVFQADERTLNQKYANDTIAEIRDDTALVDMHKALVHNPDNAKATLIKIADSIRVAPAQGAKLIRNVFSLGSQEMLRTLKRLPLYINFLDRSLAGGMAIGETLGFVIPSGGGKTTLGLQMCESSVLVNQKVAYFQFEQSLEGDLFMRVNVLASGVSKKLWEKYVQHLDDPVPMKLEDFMDAASLDRFNKTQPLWNANFLFYDYSDKSIPITSINQIFEEVEKIRAGGEEVTLVIIDWWNALIRRLLSHSGDMSDPKVRAFRASVAEDFKQGCKRHGVRGVVFQQMSGEGCQKSLKMLPSSKDSQEDKNFDNYFDYCYAFSQIDPKTGIITIKADKVRSVAKSIFKVLMDGEYCKLKDAQDPAHGMSLGPMIGNVQV